MRASSGSRVFTWRVRAWREGTVLAVAMLVSFALVAETAVAVPPDPPAVQEVETLCAAMPSDFEPFVDLVGNEQDIECLSFAAITRGGPRGAPANEYGPRLVIERDEMASFIVRLLDLKAGLAREDTTLLAPPQFDGTNSFVDVAPASPHMEAINRLARVGIVTGGPGGLAADRFGPNDAVTRAQLASLLVRAENFLLSGDAATAAYPAAPDYFVDDDGRRSAPHEDNINRITQAGIVAGAPSALGDPVTDPFTGEVIDCGEADVDCYGPGLGTTRSQMASFLVRLLGDNVEQGHIDPLPEPVSPPLTTSTTVGSGGGGGSATTSTTTSSTTTTVPPTTTTTLPIVKGVVPDVVGHTNQLAIAKIDDSGFAPALSDTKSSDTVPAGRVISQAQAPGTVLDPGSEVAYVLSSGPELVTVPDVVGDDETTARSKVTGAGLSVGRIGETTSDAVDEGEVDNQLPLPAQRVRPGTPVDVELATGVVNDPPEIISTPFAEPILEGDDYSYNAFATDPDGDDLTWILQAGPDSADIDSDTGELDWTTDDGDAGPHDLVIRVEDGHGGIDTQSWTVIVTRPNSKPIATDDVLTGRTDEPRLIEGAEILGNDTDPDSDTLTLDSFTQPGTGRVTRNGDQLTYTANRPESSDVREDIELTHALPVTVTSDKATSSSFPLTRLTDDYLVNEWFTTASQRVPITLSFAFEADVAIRRIDLKGARTSYGEDGYDIKKVDIRVLDAGGAVLFTAADLETDPDPTPGDNKDGDTSFDLVALNGDAPISGARTVEVIITEVGTRLYPGLSEIDIWGDGVPTLFRPRLKWNDDTLGNHAGPSAADLDGDGVSEVVVTRGGNRLHVYDGATGELKWFHTAAQTASQTAALGDVADCIDGAPAACRDEDLEVVYVGSTTDWLRIADARGNLISELDTGTSMSEDPVALADVDGDGDVEVIGGSPMQVVDIDRTTGALSVRYRTNVSGACGDNGYGKCIAVVVDVDLDGELEIITGHYVFDAATGEIEQRSQSLGDGFVGVANFDDDPEGEIVRVTGGFVHIVNHDFTSLWGPVPLATRIDETSRGSGGPPTIADFDGDGRAEIGIAGARVYAVYDPDVPLSDPPVSGDGVLWRAETIDGSSNRTGSTLFDFDNDGRAEVVYSDEQTLWIYDGATGAVRWSRPMSSGTTIEQPIVADVDGDGQAEIVVNLAGGRTVDGIAHPGGISVYDAPADNWVRARTIWNQHAYSVTHVSSDGSIPAVPRANWLAGGLNNFRQQSFPPDDPARLDSFTYRVSDGTATSDPATVFVDSRPPQNAPIVTCGPPATATVGFPFRARVCADDPDGDEVTFSGGVAPSATVTVPGGARPWLAGQPDGVSLGASSNLDVAPTQSPRAVQGTVITPGSNLSFDVQGMISYSGGTLYPPDGYRSGAGNPSLLTHAEADAFGLADVRAPGGALMGVFLDATVPAEGDALPTMLQYATPEQRNQLGQSPALRQPFYIGDGRTRDGQRQLITVPAGATRLYLGVMDSARWNDNSGAFEVTVRSDGDSGLTLDPASGVIKWLPTTVGSYRFEGVVTDDGTPPRSVDVAYPINVVNPAEVPGVVGLGESAARAGVEAADLVVGSVGAEFSTTVEAGKVIEQHPPAGSAAAVGSRVTFTVSKGASPADTDADDDDFTPNQGDCNDADDSINPDADEVDNDGIDQDCDGEDGGLNVQQVGISGSDSNLVVGRSRTYTAQALLADGRVIDITALATFDTTDSAVATFDGNRLTALTPGAFDATASFAGKTAVKDLTAIAGIAADEIAPIAEITSPAPGEEIATELTVTGIATDANLTGWRVSVIDASGAELAEVARGTGPISNTTFGALATAALPPGIVTIRLDVEDAGGNISRTEVPVNVLEGPQPGAFSLSMTDLTVPMPGLSLSVVRTYDSRDRQVGDFGAGWTLDLTGLDLRISRDQGIGWELVTGRFASTALQPSAEHAVTILLPDGTRDAFDLVPSPRSATFQPLQFTTAAYQPRPGSVGKLVPTGNRNLLVLQGASGVELVDDTTLNAYEPPGFLYTGRDGTRYTIDATGAVSRIEDPNGNVITVDDAGITHSAGRSVVFERDAHDRITSVTDPAGGVQRYRYSAAGDLVAHTDAEGNTTTYRYSPGHYLTEVLDPLGRTGVRYEYDLSGRVVAVIDGEGRRTEVDHALGANSEIVTDVDGDVTLLEYDAAGNIVRTVDPLGGETTRTFDAQGRMLTERDPLGRTSTMTYDAAGNLLTESDPTGATTTRTYSARGDVTSVTDALNRTTTFTYDSRGNLLTTTDSTGAVVDRRSYDSSGNLRTITDAAGATTEYTYDSGGDLVGIIDSLGRSTAVTRDALGNPSALTRPDGVATEVEYDRRGLPKTFTDGTGATTELEYDPLGVLTAAEDAAGRRAEVVLDAAGLERSVALPGLGTTTFTYTPDGERHTTTDAEGGVTTYGYDAAGRMTSEERADGTTVSKVYDSAGQVVKEVDARGGETTYSYDAAGRVTVTTDPLGATRSFTYDALGNLASEKDPVGGVTAHTYDHLGRRIATAHPDGTHTSYTYDAVGKLLTEVDAAGNETRFSYDATGALVAVTEPGGATTRAEYDEVGNLTAVTDANGHTTRYRYDDADRLVETIYPSGLSEKITYDPTGVPVTFTDRAGQTVTVATDAAGRVTEQILPDGSRIGRRYDASGGLVETTDPRGTTTYERDALDRVTAMVQPDGSRLDYGYDAAGNRTSMAAQTGPGSPVEETLYDYDQANRLVSVTDALGGVTALTYDAAGRPTGVAHPNGTSTARTFDPMHRVATVEHSHAATVLERLDYGRSPVGDVTAVTAADGRTSEYGYDARRRLTGETHRASDGAVVRSSSYTYDAVGNRLTETDGTGVTTAYSYDEENRLLAMGAVSFAYDDAGNQVARTEAGVTQGYGYDARGFMTQATTAGIGTTTYTYGANGERVARTGVLGSTGFLVDPFAPTGTSEVAAEYDAAGVTTSSFTYGPELLSQHSGGATSYVHADAVGSVGLVTDATGAVSAATRFAAFGEQVDAAGHNPTPYGFAGQRLDPETGLYHLRARQYRPETGRFTGVDRLSGILEDPVTRHPYLYGRANPLTFEDPTGEMPTLAQVAVTSGLITGLVKFVQAPVGKGLEAAVRGFIVGALVGAAAFWLGGSVAVGIGGTVKNFFFLGGFGNATATAVFVPVLAVMLGVKAIFGVISSFGDFRLNPENKGKPFKICSAFVASYLGEILSLGLGGSIAKGVREAAQPLAENLFAFLLGVGGDMVENRVSC